jgi:Rps23 Pro-64 3,4-dihydroxylase Tpa1-like proline 4-hydroxylase
MKIKIVKTQDLPVAIVDNFYTDLELKRIMNFCAMSNPYSWFRDPNKNGGAKDDNGKDKKNSYALCVDDWYTPVGRKFCDLFIVNRKLWDKKFTDKLEKSHKLFSTIKAVNRDTTFLNYYEDKNSYDFHTDTAVFTVLTFFFKKPKKFSGGELLIEKDIKIDCENNRMVIFPSILDHKVETVNIKTKAKLHGRFSMTQFLNYR